MHYLHLKKPLVFLDLETTGVNVVRDRIVEIGMVKAMPDGSLKHKAERINPEVAIPHETSLIHGIYEEDVREASTFKQVARNYAQFLEGCDLAGFNILRFDLPLLVEEFLRADVPFDTSQRRVLDAQRIYHLMESRSLTAALKFYCDKDMSELGRAHSAETDALATYHVLNAQVKRYEGVTIHDIFGKASQPVANDVAHLHQLTAEKMVDLAGRFKRNEQDEVVVAFGKHMGRKLADVLRREPAFYDWVMNGEFPLDTKRRLTEFKLQMALK